VAHQYLTRIAAVTNQVVAVAAQAQQVEMERLAVAEAAVLVCSSLLPER
jgi:hypothetical protein